MSGTNIGLRDRYINALGLEMGNYTDFFDGDPIHTLYIGGGTPSLLSVTELKWICDTVADNWDLRGVEEFTIECNPDDLNEQYLKDLFGLQVSVCSGNSHAARLSIGVQSFVDSELMWLNRRHTAREALNAVRIAQDVGYGNISIDLMFALPVQTIQSLNNTLDVALQLEVQHISAYSLMFEPDSKITKLMQLQRLEPLDDDVAADMYELLSKRVTESGYAQYEISNYAVLGCESKHNSGYWHGMRYLGLGPSAHSYDGVKRWSNIAHTLKYIENPFNRAIEEMTEDERFNELVFTALRTRQGLLLDEVRAKFGDVRCDRLIRQSERFIDSGHVRIAEGRLALTHEGIYISDAIMSEFMIV